MIVRLVILVCLGRRDPRRDVEKTRASHCFSALVSAKLRKSFPVHLYNASRETACMCRRTGGSSEEGTPVPISNTEVKLFSSDDTLGVAPRENRSSPFHLPIWAVFSFSAFLVSRSRTPGGETFSPAPVWVRGDDHTIIGCLLSSWGTL